MEKRLFLAIGLSLLVVWLWSVTAPRPKLVNQKINDTKVTDNKEVKETQKTTPSSVSSGPASPAPAASAKIEERIEKLVSDKLEIYFNNIGGSIDKAVVRKFHTSLPLTNIDSITGYENIPFTLDAVGDNTISYSFEDERQKIVKSYSVEDGSYTVKSTTQVYNKYSLPLPFRLESGGYMVEMSNLKEQAKHASPTFNRDKSLFEYTISTEKEIFRKARAFKFSPKENQKEFATVNWAGFRDRYYCALIKPLYKTKGYSIDTISETELKVTVDAEDATISPNGNVQFESVMYIGPEEIHELKPYGYNFEKIKRYYKFGLFDGIAKIIESMMEVIHKVIPNWGVTIILISIIIYFSMYPLTLKGMKSMKKMQSLQPMIAKLKEKHKDNPQKMNKEMMELYKEHKVNPVGGCLPMFLQMPVFIGLYQVLWRSVSFKGAGFLWIKDLSEPDRLFIMHFKLPVLGNEFNLLPIIMIGVMYFQQRVSAKNMVATDPQQAAQQKMMTTILPVFLGCIFYKFASGLTLYFTMFYTFSTFTQWKMSKVNKGA